MSQTAEIKTEFADLLAAAEQVLSRQWGAEVRLGHVQRLSHERRRNLLLRCAVLDGPTGTPESLVIKQARQHKYDPDDPKSRPAVGLFRDWAGLEFLATLDEHQLACPRFYGGHREAGFFLMEDLGGARELDDVLTRGSANEARHALLLLAESLGHMHAISAGHGEEYQKIRDVLGPGDGRQRLRLADHARDYAPALVERCESLNVKVAPEFAADIEHVARVMADPGPFLTYTHGDACPDNCVLSGDRLRLFDFEFGNFRHALLDGVYGRIRFPTCWCVRDIPAPVVADMELVYRRELVQGCPAAADDHVYSCAVADACAYWILENLVQLFDRAMQYEEPKGTATNRQRILTRLAEFCEVAERAGHLAGLRQTLERLLAVLRQRWSDNMPSYDAFGQHTSLHHDEVQAMFEGVRACDLEHVTAMLMDNAGLANAKLDDPDQTPILYLAVAQKNEELIRLLLDHGADWRIGTRTGWTVLARACSDGTPEIVDLLLDREADLNTRDVWGSLPIYSAVATRDPKMLKHLLARGARPDVKLAIDLNQLDLARRLLQRDSSQARIRFGTGLSLLHDSAQVGDTRLEAMELLLKSGAAVNATTNWGATPLHLATFHAHPHTVELLLKNAADMNAKDKQGLTPRKLAEGRGHGRCAELLGGARHSAESKQTNNAGSTTDYVEFIDKSYTSFGGARVEELHAFDDFDLRISHWHEDE
jgi:ankyrin repeat protein